MVHFSVEARRRSPEALRGSRRTASQHGGHIFWDENVSRDTGAAAERKEVPRAVRHCRRGRCRPGPITSTGPHWRPRHSAALRGGNQGRKAPSWVQGGSCARARRQRSDLWWSGPFGLLLLLSRRVARSPRSADPWSPGSTLPRAARRPTQSMPEPVPMALSFFAGHTLGPVYGQRGVLRPACRWVQAHGRRGSSRGNPHAQCKNMEESNLPPPFVG